MGEMERINVWSCFNIYFVHLFGIICRVSMESRGGILSPSTSVSETNRYPPDNTHRINLSPHPHYMMGKSPQGILPPLTAISLRFSGEVTQ